MKLELGYQSVGSHVAFAPVRLNLCCTGTSRKREAAKNIRIHSRYLLLTDLLMNLSGAYIHSHSAANLILSSLSSSHDGVFMIIIHLHHRHYHHHPSLLRGLLPAFGLLWAVGSNSIVKQSRTFYVLLILSAAVKRNCLVF